MIWIWLLTCQHRFDKLRYSRVLAHEISFTHNILSQLKYTEYSIDALKILITFFSIYFCFLYFVQVAWIHIDRQMILTIHRHVISRIPRYSITYDNANTWLLHVNQAQQDDRGYYMCQVENKFHILSVFPFESSLVDVFSVFDCERCEFWFSKYFLHIIFRSIQTRW